MRALLNKKSATLSVAIIVATALVLMQPSQMWAQQPSTTQASASSQVTSMVFPQIFSCNLSKTQPLNGIDMSTVSVRTMVKTVHVEKEFFNCIAQPSPGVTIPVIVMVSIYNELFENLTSGSVTKINSVESCAKEMNGTVLGCKMVTPSPNLIRLNNCINEPLAFPVRMNMVTATGPGTLQNVAETVEAEKEIFGCNPNPVNNQPSTIEDVVIFTKILEDMNTGKTIATKFVVVTCTKDIATTNVACK